MQISGQDSLRTRNTLKVGDAAYDYYSLEAASAELGDLSRLPYSLKVLLENLLRNEDGRSVTVDDIRAMAAWLDNRRSTREIAYRPARVLMQDFTGVPGIVDLAAMREAMVELGGDPDKINPLSRVDLVVDHSVQVDSYGQADSFRRNVELEYQRNAERYAFLRWGASAFNNFRVVPPGVGICHQVNLEYLSQVVWTSKIGNSTLAYPDTVVGTDSHTTMVNGLGVLSWGVGGIEAEAAMLGQPVSMLIPEVIGFKLNGTSREGTTATDLVLTVTQMLRAKGVVGKFVEFYGSGLDQLPLADRATIGNMAPEYGATCGIFPVDSQTIDYLRLTGREEAQVKLVEAYAKDQGMWRDRDTVEPVFTDTMVLDLSTVEPSLAGPKRPQDRVALSDAKKTFLGALPSLIGDSDPNKKIALDGMDCELTHGDLAIAAITSCTNTSNPGVMIAAGLLARHARKKGLSPKPYVKTSLAPGSKAVTDYLEKTGLLEDLEAIGFDLVGYGCTTCIGNSGPLPEAVSEAIDQGGLVATAVLSGNRNFEGRVHSQVKANFLASPPLVVAYALAGSLKVDLTREALGTGSDGKPVYLKDIWPSPEEIQTALHSGVTDQVFKKTYATVFEGDEAWESIGGSGGQVYEWDEGSTYCRRPPYFEGITLEPGGIANIEGARVLAILGDSVTTDHISPAGAIAKDSPAATYFMERQIRSQDFNSYGSRRGNHEVMMRGTFANIRLRNEMAPDTEGGWTKLMPDGEVMSIYDAAMVYKEWRTPLVIFGGKEYGTGSSRDWAAKGTFLLGVKAVIVESFERIHRSNLVGMGVLPLMFKDGVTRKSLGLDGSEVVDVRALEVGITPGMDVPCTITRSDGRTEEITLRCRIDTADEVAYYRHGGILQYVLRQLAKNQ